MEHLIDTSALIEAERGRIDMASRLREHPSAGFHLSVITASELLHGVERADYPVRRTRRSEFVELLLDRIPIVGIDLSVARMHASLWAHLAASGQMIGAHDLWIAATCLSRSMTLVTSNLREFRRVPGLMVEEWQE